MAWFKSTTSAWEHMVAIWFAALTLLADLKTPQGLGLEGFLMAWSGYAVQTGHGVDEGIGLWASTDNSGDENGQNFWLNFQAIYSTMAVDQFLILVKPVKRDRWFF